MAIVKYTVGRESTPEEEEAARKRIAAAARRPYVYDPDCPLLTEAQLAEFRPVHFSTMEERTEAMRKADVIDPETARTPSVWPHPARETQRASAAG
ncbi:MAG: hypothetical protein MdMp014T_2305 [Treponematales bacterium]